MWSGLNGRKTSAQFSDSAPKFQIPRKWPEEQFKSWLKKGWELAKKVRAKLPAEVDLFYEWKSFKKNDSEWGYGEIGILVPDERLLKA